LFYNKIITFPPVAEPCHLWAAL